MKKDIFVLIGVLWSGFNLLAQNESAVTELQYWIDDKIETIQSSPTLDLDIECADIPNGLHSLHFRLKDSAGNYSYLYDHGFFKFTPAVKPAKNVVTLQYWWDDDNSTFVETPYSDSELALSTDNLPVGLHSFKYRVKDGSGQWSGVSSHYFYKTNSTYIAPSKIESIQYWWDASQDASVLINYTENELDLNTEGLKEGLHSFNYRVKDDTGVWSEVKNYHFYKVNTDAKVATEIVSIQYWWDDLNENVSEIPYSTEEILAYTDALLSGLHSFNIRVKDDAGEWSEIKSYYFYKGDTISEAEIISYSYWWNDLKESTVTVELETPAKEFEFGEDLKIPEEAKTNYAGHYTATFNFKVTDNRGIVAFTTCDITYPDNDAPTSIIDAESYTANSTVKVFWEETSGDDMGDFNVYYSKDDSPFLLWLPDTKETSASFKGESGSRYRFTVTARDSFGNRENYDESKCVSVIFE